eukprot:4190322-Amphidinium_carterae.2
MSNMVDSGRTWESHPRHIDLLVAEVGLHHCKSLSSPATTHKLKDHKLAADPSLTRSSEGISCSSSDDHGSGHAGLELRS